MQNVEIITNIEVEVKKLAKGRPSQTKIKTDENYFKNYYYLTRKDLICECGQLVNNKNIIRHKTRAVHARRMKLIEEQKLVI